MKKQLFILTVLLAQFGFAQQNKVQVDAFLPEIFAQFPNVRDISISAAEDEIFFTIQSYQGELSAIAQIKKSSGKWSEPVVTSFSGKYQDLEPFLSPDALRLYFSSNRPLDGTGSKTKDYDIWYVSRSSKNAGWSQPVNIGRPVNTAGNEFYPAVSNNNNLYFTADTPNTKGKDDIFVSKWKNGSYQAPFSLSDTINTAGYEFNAFIAPDESYIVYTGYNREEGAGSGDLYISHNKGNDEWSTAKNLGKTINSPFMDYCPFINTQTSTLYFTSKRNTVAKIFEQAQRLPELKKEMNKYENGLSRIYKVENVYFLTR